MILLPQNFFQRNLRISMNLFTFYHSTDCSMNCVHITLSSSNSNGNLTRTLDTNKKCNKNYQRHETIKTTFDDKNYKIQSYYQYTNLTLKLASGRNERIINE